MLKAVAADETLANRIWKSFFPASLTPQRTAATPLPASSSDSARLNFAEFVTHLYFITKASAEEKFLHLFTHMPQDSVDAQQLYALLRDAYEIQLDVIHLLIPDMVFRRAKDLQATKPGVFADATEGGVRVLSMLGVTDSVLEQVAKQLDETLNRMFSEIVPVLSLTDSAAGHPYPPQSPQVLVTLPQWITMWDKHSHVLEMITVVGVSSIIDWAFALENANLQTQTKQN